MCKSTLLCVLIKGVRCGTLVKRATSPVSVSHFTYVCPHICDPIHFAYAFCHLFMIMQTGAWHEHFDYQCQGNGTMGNPNYIRNNSLLPFSSFFIHTSRQPYPRINRVP